MRKLDFNKMKGLHTLSLAVLLLLSINTNVKCENRGEGVVDAHGRLQVYDGYVCAEDGTQISLGGMSLYWSCWDGGYYTSSTLDYLVDNFDISIIRAAAAVAYTPDASTTSAVEGGVLDGNYDGTLEQVEEVVNAAIDRGIYVIVDWHVEGDAQKEDWWLEQAQSFFTYFAQNYGSYPNIIYELYNEPAYDGDNTENIQSFCQNVANTIREYDSDNLIICGSSTWSQYPNSYSITDDNTAYSFHAYPDASYGDGHMTSFYNNVDAAIEMGNAVFVTEFGTQTDSHTRTDELIEACQERNMSMCAWTVNNKDEDWSIFSGSGTSTLTEVGTYYQEQLVNWPTVEGSGSSSCTDATSTSVPATIEAEDYCESDGIETEDCDEGTDDVGYIDDGDWMAYKIDVPSDGTYTISYRVASESGGGTLQFESQGGETAYGTIEISSTGGWQEWTTVSHEVELSAGVQSVAIAAVSGGWNINWFNIALSGTSSVQIEAEDYTYMSGVEIEDCDEGGSNVGYIDDGDWLSYHGVDLPAGSYTVQYRVASLYGGGVIQLEEAGGELVYGTVDVPATDDWQEWITVSLEVTISSDVADIGIAVPTGGYNLNWIKFISSSLKSTREEQAVENIEVNESVEIYPNPVKNNLSVIVTKESLGSQLRIFEVSGKMVKNKLVSETQFNLDLSELTAGIYFVQINNHTKRFIKE